MFMSGIDKTVVRNANMQDLMIVIISGLLVNIWSISVLVLAVILVGWSVNWIYW